MVNCSFTRGTLTGIIGPNGSGKTTLLRALSRAIPSSGIIELCDREISTYPAAELSTKLGYVPQNEDRSFSYPVMQVVLMARYARNSRFAALASKDYDICRKALKDTGISQLRDRAIGTLSGGEWQRVLIARALAQETEVLMLDEPTAHLDIAHQTGILSLMRELAEAGTTVISVFHDLNLAARYCDRLILVCDGNIIAGGSPSEVLTTERLRTVYGIDILPIRDPASGKMYLLAGNASSETIRANPLRVLIISGGGSGTGLLHFLSKKGVALSAGILATTDTDYLTVTTLGIPFVPVLPFSKIPEDALENLRKISECSDRIVLCIHPFGFGNLEVLQFLQTVNPEKIVFYLPEGKEYPEFDFTGGAAQAILTALQNSGVMSGAWYSAVWEHLSKALCGERE